MTKIDLKDAYYSVPVHPSLCKYLRFKFNNSTFRVPMPTVRPLLCPSNLHEDSETSRSTNTFHGYLNRYFSGRHSDYASRQDQSSEDLQP